MENKKINVFQKYLSVFVILCMIIGVMLGKLFPQIPLFFNKFEFYQVSIPVAILIWIMIYPMMMKIDFKSIKFIKKNPAGLIVTWVSNWLIQPFSMFLIASFFFFIVFKNIIPTSLSKEYLAGAIILGTAPCTAMVFVWSKLTKGNATYTIIQVATNDLIILFAYVPIVGFLLGTSDITVPYKTLVLSIVLFVLIPLIFGIVTRYIVTKRKSKEYFEESFVNKFDNITTIGLLLTLILLFSFQGELILNNPLHIVLIAIPLLIQTLFIFSVSYSASYIIKLPHEIAAPSSMISASNFFELAVAVSISLFGLNSPAALATTVGVLIEVPVMLFLVKIVNKTRLKFETRYKTSKKYLQERKTQ